MQFLILCAEIPYEEVPDCLLVAVVFDDEILHFLCEYLQDELVVICEELRSKCRNKSRFYCGQLLIESITNNWLFSADHTRFFFSFHVLPHLVY